VIIQEISNVSGGL